MSVSYKDQVYDLVSSTKFILAQETTLLFTDVQQMADVYK